MDFIFLGLNLMYHLQYQEYIDDISSLMDSVTWGLESGLGITAYIVVASE